MGKDPKTWKKHTQLVAADDSGGVVHCTWHSKVVLPRGWRKDGHRMYIKHIGNLEGGDVTEAFHTVPKKFGKKKALQLLKDLAHCKKEVRAFAVKAGDSLELLD